MKDIHNEAVTPEMFVGKTIAALNAECCNQMVFTFSDGTRLALHIECGQTGLPSVLACNTCIDD